MASTASNATSTWPTRLCICGAGPCIPRKSGSRAKHPGKWYYDCPGDPPCREWNGWCNESIPNIAHSQDDSMSSPGGGRGKGNWSTPRKQILQPSEERNFSQVSPRRQFSQSYEQPHFSRYYDQPNFDQAAQEANFSQHTHTSMLSPSVGRGRGMRASPYKTLSHASRQPNFSLQDQQFWQPSPQIYQPTSSPSRGRGRGIRTSPRKAFSQPAEHAYGMQHSQQPYFSQPAQNPCTNTIDRAKWTSLSVKSLLEACAEEIDENGRAVNGFSKQAWARILNAVMGKTGRKFTKKQLKDKHDRLKEEWKAWILVAEDKRQTGLGRNPETGAITGPDHWWAAMIARNSHVAKFRNQGLEHEGLMGRVFRDITAMGNEAIFPGEGIEEIGEGSGDSEGMHVEGGSVPQSQEQYQTSVSKGKHPIGQTSTVGGSHSSRKRKWTDVHEAMTASFAESVDRFKSTPSIVINRSGKWGIENAIEKLDTLPMFQVDGQNLEFHSWACRLFERQQHKIDIFCSQKSMADAIQWLRDEHSLAEDRYYTTPPGSQRRGLQPPPFPHVPVNVDV